MDTWHGIELPTDKGLKLMERGNLLCLHPAVTQKRKTYKVGRVGSANPMMTTASNL